MLEIRGKGAVLCTLRGLPRDVQSVVDFLQNNFDCPGVNVPSGDDVVRVDITVNVGKYSIALLTTS